MRNFLTVVSLNSSLLASDPSLKHSALVAGITQATECLESLLDELQFEKMQSTHTLRHADVDSTLAQVATFAASSYPNIRFSLPMPTGVVLQIDQTQLSRCLFNLAANAAEAAAFGSSALRLVEFKVTLSGDHLTIHVLDSGDGFPQEDPARAFDAFVSERPNQSCHSGLGLHVVRSLVEQAGGRVSTKRVESLTEVRIEFPMRIVQLRESRKQDAASRKPQRSRTCR